MFLVKVTTWMLAIAKRDNLYYFPKKYFNEHEVVEIFLFICVYKQ
jgi:hypothetical protein